MNTIRPLPVNHISNDKRFASLDSLKFLAFTHVFLLHALGGTNMERLFGSTIGALFSFAFGSFTFLLLSGFLTTSSILNQVKKDGRFNIIAFYRRRILRIWPLYFTFITVAFVLFSILGKYTSADTVMANHPVYYYFFLVNFDILQMGPELYGKNLALATLWTLSVLEQFYLVWALLFYFIPQRYYWSLFIIVLIPSLAFTIIHIENTYMLRIHTLSACSTVVLGGLVAYLVKRFEQVKTFFQEASRLTIFLCYIGWIVLLINHNDLIAGTYAYILRNLFYASFILFIILEQGFSKYSPFKLSQIRLFAFWGKYNYGFYLFHSIALFAVHVCFRLAGIDYNSNLLLAVIVAILAFGLTLLMSYLSYEYFEKRFIPLKASALPEFIEKEKVKSEYSA